MTDGPIDASVFNELADTTGADFVGELVAAFLDEAPGMIADLRDAAAQDDADRFRRAAHSIKSNALIFGAHQLGAMARDLEVSDQPASQTTPDQLAALDAAFATAAARLKELVDG
jgi:HPt (histidine-containing phosphotransfer) domain-containing protein